MKINKYKGALIGLIVGDALGVPLEFKTRKELKEHPVTDMTGYGTHHQPLGTWSDDSSMTIATVEWLLEMQEYDVNYNALMDKFVKWFIHGEYTAHDETFDYGNATCSALYKYMNGVPCLECGGTNASSNGNGSLMRILPFALWSYQGLLNDDVKVKQFIYDGSSLTHAHLRSKIACFLYANIIADLFNGGKDKFGCVKNAIKRCRNSYESEGDNEVHHELFHYQRLWDVDKFSLLEEDEIKSSGYVVDTLEAALWCFLNTNCYEDCVLKAVNLGDDTDTVAAVAGGLAGLYYGFDAIPSKWLKSIVRYEWIETKINQLVQKDLGTF